MPDLQSELSKIADAWDAHENTIRQPAQTNHQENTMQTTPVPKTGNLTRDIFYYIKAGQFTREQVCEAFAADGHKRRSVSSLLTQMLRAGLVEERTWHLYPLREEYKPLGLYKANQPRPSRLLTTPAQSAAGIDKLPAAKPEPRSMTAESVMASMNVAEAYKLYVELHAMFGGK